MEDITVTQERRNNPRYDASALNVEVRTLGWFGLIRKGHKAFARDFNLDGMSIVSGSKLKIDQNLLISLGCDTHLLQSIPMLVTRCRKQDNKYVLVLQFNLDGLSEAARNAAYAALKSVENELKQSSFA